MGVGGQCYATAPLSPVRRPGTHCTVGWVGPRAGLDHQKINRFSDWQNEKKKIFLLQRNQKIILVIVEWK